MCLGNDFDKPATHLGPRAVALQFDGKHKEWRSHARGMASSLAHSFAFSVSRV